MLASETLIYFSEQSFIYMINTESEFIFFFFEDVAMYNIHSSSFEVLNS